MHHHSRGRTIRTSSIRPVAAIAALALSTSCASFFKITPEEGAAPATPKVEEPKVEKPKPEPKVEAPKLEKPKPEPKVEAPKPEPKKIEAPKVEAPKPAEKPVEVAKAPEKKPEPEKAKPAPAKPENAPRPVAIAPPTTARLEPTIEPPALEPTPAGSDSAGVARLVNAAMLYDAIRLFHPAVARDGGEWDNATVRRLTDVRTATTRDQYVTTIREWLSRLNDPVTRFSFEERRDANAGPVSSEVATQSQVVTTGTKKNRVVDTTVVLTWPRSAPSTDSAAWSNLRSAIQSNGGASQMVIDLRTDRLSTTQYEMQGGARSIQLDAASSLSTMNVAGPSVRRRVHEGWKDERDGVISSTGASWRVTEPLVNVRAESNNSARRVVIVANANTALAPAFMALVASKQATLVSEAPLSDALLVPTRRVPVGQGLSVDMRVGEVINADGSVGVQPDTMVSPVYASADSAPVMRTAVRVARGQVAPRAVAGAGTTSLAPATVSSDSWRSTHYPIMGARLLAAMKTWGTLRAFHAYDELRDENLDEALQRFIPRIEAASDAYAYASVMLEYSSALDDAQASLRSPTIEQHLGTAVAPFVVRWIEGRAIVTQVASNDAGRATGLTVGDEITAADGYPMPAYVNEHRKYGPASNEWTSYRNVMALVPRGQPGDAIFKARDAGNRERSLTVPRAVANVGSIPASDRAANTVFREFTGRIGYLDLDRATVAQVDSAFTTLVSTRALIIDARGRGTGSDAGAMTPAMTRVLRRIAAPFNSSIDRQTVRVASEPCVPAALRAQSASCVVERRQFEDLIAADGTERYAGRVVVLIDERTQGAMEQFGLGVESLGNPTFIGSASAGAAGQLTSVKLPGQMTLVFSGSELRHTDGRQLQRVGLTPQVDVAPTVKGIRAGNDEVLTRAQEWLLQQLDPAPVRRRGR
jgi:C-terminal processing protease CtpA/Prc